MESLSNDPRALKGRYGIIVVGSGYGGAITAARLAAAGHSVCLLERGREWLPGSFPDALPEVIKAVRSDSNPLGLFDYIVGDEQDVLVGNGLGGTSLINANVVIRPEDDLFLHQRWPVALRQAYASGEFMPYMQQVASMLQATADGPRSGWPRKVQAMQQSATPAGGTFTPLAVAVNFRTYDNQPNHVGVVQQLCTLCGDCVTGCNVGAKNTLTMNYLPLARQHGAEIYTAMEVEYLLAAPAGGYFVYVRQHGEPGTSQRVLHAAGVVLAAGALGSTGILLRSQERGLPLSRRLGHQFSGNADTLSLGFNTDIRTDVLGFGNHRDERAGLAAGPTILSMLDFRQQPQLAEPCIIEEGAIPRALVDTVRRVAPLLSVVQGRDTDRGFGDQARELARVIRDQVRFDPEGAANHSMVYLGMGHDGADGRIVLDHRGRPRVLWHALPERPVFHRINERMHRMVAALGGTYMQNPRWSELLGRNLITVHPLGGCPMGEDADSGVVNHFGQVFDPGASHGSELHPGLYVIDGSILPTSVGVNPLLTISALAERAAAHIAARGAVALTPASRRLVLPVPPVLPVGLEFTEDMRGFYSHGVQPARTPEEYEAAAAAGKQQGRVLTVRLYIVIDDIAAFLEHSQHEARAAGSIDGIAGRRCPVDHGSFNLFVDDAVQHTRRMRYRLAFRGDDGQPYLLQGFKEMRHDAGFDAWGDATTLFVTIRRGWTDDASVLGQGIINIHIVALMQQIASIRARNSPDVATGLRWVNRFGRFFFGSLWDTYARQQVPGVSEDQDRA